MNNNKIYCRRPTLDEFDLFLGVNQELKSGRWTIIEFDGLSVTKHSFRLSIIWGLLIIKPTEKENLDILGTIEEYGFNLSDFDKNAPQGIINSIPIDFITWAGSISKSIRFVTDNYGNTNNEHFAIVCKHLFWAMHINSIYNDLRIKPYPETDKKTISQFIKLGKTKRKDCQYLLESKSDAAYYLKTMIKKDESSYITENITLYEQNTYLELDSKNQTSKHSLCVSPYLQDSLFCDLIIIKNDKNQEVKLNSYRISSSSFPVNIKVLFTPLWECPVLEFDENTIVENQNNNAIVKKSSKNNHVEILVLIDATILQERLEYIFNHLSQLFKNIVNYNSDIKLGLIAFGDQNESGFSSKAEYASKVILNEFVPYIQWKQAADTFQGIKALDFMTSLAEGMESVLNFKWSENKDKYLIIVGYRPPHPYKWPNDGIYAKQASAESKLDWEEIQQKLIDKNIKQISIFDCSEDMYCNKNVKPYIEESKKIWKKIGRNLFIDNIEKNNIIANHIFKTEESFEILEKKIILPVINGV